MYTLNIMHHELVRKKKVTLIHDNLVSVMLGIQHQWTVVIDGPAAILQQNVDYFDGASSTFKMKLLLTHNSRSFRIFKSISIGKKTFFNYHSKTQNVFWKGSRFKSQQVFIWSTPSIKVCFCPIYVKLKENQSTQHKMLSKFWHSEARVFLRRHWSFFTLDTFVKWTEHPHYYNDEIPPIRNAFSSICW